MPPSATKTHDGTMSNIGVPIKLLHEAEGHIVTCEVRARGLPSDTFFGVLLRVAHV